MDDDTKQLGPNKMAAGSTTPTLAHSLHEAAGVTADLAQGLSPDRASRARAEPHSSRGSLLNAADILPGCSLDLKREDQSSRSEHARFIERRGLRIWRAHTLGKDGTPADPGSPSRWYKNATLVGARQSEAFLQEKTKNCFKNSCDQDLLVISY